MAHLAAGLARFLGVPDDAKVLQQVASEAVASDENKYQATIGTTRRTFFVKMMITGNDHES